jgi:hypothetical protein
MDVFVCDLHLLLLADVERAFLAKVGSNAAERAVGMTAVQEYRQAA